MPANMVLHCLVISSTKRLLMEATGYDAPFRYLFPMPPFSVYLSMQETERFRKRCVLKPFSKYSFFTSVFRRFSLVEGGKYVRV